MCSKILIILFLMEFWRRLGWPHLSRSCLNLLPYSVGQKSTIIAVKLMKVAGYLVKVALINGYWKNLIFDGQFFLAADLKWKQTQLLCTNTLLLHYQQMGWLTDSLWITCSNSPPRVYKSVIRLALSCVLVTLWAPEVGKNQISGPLATISMALPEHMG